MLSGSNKTSFLRKLRTENKGMSGLGILIFFMTLMILIIIPLTVGSLEYQLFETEKNQIKIAAENAVFSTLETVDPEMLGKGTAEPDLSEFVSAIESNLAFQNCGVVPDNLDVEVVNGAYIVVTFDYIHRIKSIQFDKKMSVFLTYDIPKDT